MLAESRIQELARGLEEARINKVPMTQLSVLHPDMTVDEAYAVQRAWRELQLAGGRTMRGRKIGLTSRTMQKAQSVDEPDRGYYLDDMVHADGAILGLENYIQPRVEVELAFELSRPLAGPNITTLDVLEATAWVQPALEILDSRLQMKDPETGALRKIADAIGDNAANAGMVLGGRPVRPTDIDLRWVAALLYVNGSIEESGVSAAVMNHPAAGIAWLANSLAPYGEVLEARQPIISGSFTRPVFAHKGDLFHADFGPLGPVTCQFV